MLSPSSSHPHACSHCFPEIFPHLSQIIPSFAPRPAVFPSLSQLFPLVFPRFSQHLPMVFPDHSQFCPHPHGFLIHVFPNLFHSFPRSFLDLATCQALNILEPDSCGLKNKPIPDCFPGNPKVFPAHSVISIAKRFLDSIVILLVPSQTEAAPY